MHMIYIGQKFSKVVRAGVGGGHSFVMRESAS
jgi:hypothetical protein